MKHLILLSFLAAIAGTVCARENDAKQEVAAILARSGVRIGVDSANSRYVFIGVAERKIADPANAPDFMKEREACSCLAELRAKRDLMKARMVRVTIKDTAAVVGDGENTGIQMESLCKFIAEDKKHGSVTLCSAESWDPDSQRYQVAVAVAWSAKLEEQGALLKAAAMPNDDLTEDDPAWGKWAKSVRLESVLGSRQFKDENGNRRYVGVGAKDVDGLMGLKLKSAMRVAQMYAIRNLAFSVYSDSVSRDVAKSVLRQIQQGAITQSDAWESYESEVKRRCDSLILRGHRVYETDELRHPITGHKLYIVVYGIEPDQIPALKKQ